MNQNRVLHGVRFGMFVVAATVVLGFVIKGLWNALLPGLFGLHAITFWQAIGLFVLSKLLFGGFHKGGGGGRNRWRNKMKERWDSMSEEEREKFRAGMRGRRGCWPPREAEPQG